MPVICIVNQKGGVGKTTTAAALAHGLSEHGKRVLLIDWDPQASLTISLGFNPEQLQKTVYNALVAVVSGNGTQSILDVIAATTNPSVDLAPANVELSQSQLDLVTIPQREQVLKEIIQPVRKKYDFILIDCLPSLGLLTINALVAADKVLIPLQADFLAMKGLAMLLTTIIRVKERLNHGLEIAGVVFTMTNPRTLHCKEVIDVTKKAFSNRIHVFETVIPTSVRFKEAPAAGQTILSYAPDSDGAQAYRLLTKEVMDNETGKHH